jgi:hypothetical protein
VPSTSRNLPAHPFTLCTTIVLSETADGGAGPDVIAETAQAALADLRAERSVELERLVAQRSRRALGVPFRVIG